MLRCRWPLFALGAILLVFGGLALAALMAKAGFRFLAGQQPISTFDRLGGGKRLVYTFRSDYRELVRMAKREVGADGWYSEETHPYLSGSNSGTAVWTGQGRHLRIHENARGRAPAVNTLETRFDSEWVTVIVDKDAPPSFWDRFTRLLGF